MLESKYSVSLRQTASKALPGEPVQVLVELEEKPEAAPRVTASRAERMELRKQCFARDAQPVKEKIARLGGQVLDEAWLNSTISARLPKAALEELSHDDRVRLLDLPHPLERE